MMKFSDNYIKWGTLFYLIFSTAFCVILGFEAYGVTWQEAWPLVKLITVIVALNIVILVAGKNIVFRTVIVDEKGVREKVFGKVKKEYAWGAVVDCGVCSRWVGSYWQYLVFFSDKPVTEKARYGRENKKGATMSTFITFPLCTDALHAIHSYATPEVIEMFEGEYHPGNFQALQNMLANYRKEPRCLLPDAEKEEPPR